MTQRDVPDVQVFLDGNFAADFHPITVSRTCGGLRMDYAVLQLEQSSGFSDASLLSFGQPQCIIKMFADSEEKILHWGKVQSIKLSISEGGQEELQLVSSIEPFHFGQPIYGQVQFHNYNQDFFLVNQPIIFNPEIDDKIWGNMRVGNEQPETDCRTFYDPDSARSDDAQIFNGDGDGPELWKFSRVIHYLCCVGNELQTYIDNPTLEELEAIVIDEGSTAEPDPEDPEAQAEGEDLVRDLHVRDGMYLSQALDAVLTPFGYSWFISLDNEKPKIRIFKRGTGLRDRMVRLQAVGSELDVAYSDVLEANIDLDAAELYNQVRGLGGYIEIESTWELRRGWEDDKDDLANEPDVLKKSYPSFNDNRYVWRRWVLNEAGDYNSIRSDDFTFPHDFSEILPLDDYERWIPRRLRFYPCLTLAPDEQRPIGKVHGCVVEYLDVAAASSPGTAEWVEYPSGVHLLSDQCGILFDDMDHPDLISRNGEEAKVRITAAIRFPLRIESVAVKQDDSPQSDVCELFLNLQDRFHYRTVHEQSKFFDDVQDETRKANEADDQVALSRYCEQVRSTWDGAAIHGPFTLEGIDRTRYELGDSIVGIEGRNIPLHGKYNESFPPQIVGLTYDIQRQQMVLTTQQYRADKRFLQDKGGIRGELGGPA